MIDALEKNDWCPFGLGVVVKDGIVHLSGVITEERSRQAAVVAAETVEGVKKVHDHLCWVDTMSGIYLNSPEEVGEGELSLCLSIFLSENQCPLFRKHAYNSFPSGPKNGCGPSNVPIGT